MEGKFAEAEIGRMVPVQVIVPVTTGWETEIVFQSPRRVARLASALIFKS